jgi:tetratricopeptide (TPR) repeat protein
VSLRGGALVAIVALLSGGCESDEQKVADLFALGQSHAEEGLHPEAVIEFRSALQIDPNRADVHFALANSYMQVRSPSEALWEYAETIRLDPDNRDARLRLGALALVRQDPEEALEQADSSIALDPEEPTAYLLRGQALEGLNRLSEAGDSYSRAIQIAPEEGAYLFVYARLLTYQDNRDDAEATLVKMTEVDPSYFSYKTLAGFLAADPSRDAQTEAVLRTAIEAASSSEKPEGYETLATFLIARERFEDASTALEAGIAELQDQPNESVRLMRVLAEVLEGRGMKDQATALLEQAVAIAPDSPETHLFLAARREAEGDFVGALAAAEQAVAVAPDHVRSKLKKAEYLMVIASETGDDAQMAEASAIIDAVLEAEPSQPEALYTRGRMKLIQRDLEAAITAFRASIDSRPESAHAHLMLGRALTAAGDKRAARGEVARALELDPSLTPARYLLIRLHAALGEHEYAIEQGRLYLRRNPDPQLRMIVAQSLARLGRTQDALVAIDRIPEDKRTVEVLFARARLLVEAGQLEAAHADLLAALKERPNHAVVLRTLMDLEDRLGRIAESWPRIDAALARDPDNAELARLRGSYALKTGDLATAEKMFERTLELDESNVAAFRQLAQIYQNANRIDEAIATYEQALIKSPDSAILHHLLAVLHQMKGENELAMAGYEKAISLDDGMAESKNNIAYLLAESGTDLQRALDLAQEAKAQRPEDPGAADTLGWVLYRRGIPGAAVGYLREAVAGMDAGSEEIGLVRHHLALAYEANDQKQLAIDTLELTLAELEARQAERRAAGAQPTDPEWAATAREALGRL